MVIRRMLDEFKYLVECFSFAFLFQACVCLACVVYLLQNKAVDKMDSNKIEWKRNCTSKNK